MSCSSTCATHHLACACREAQWAARLAAAEREAERLREALTTINLMCADGYYGPYSYTYAMEAKRLASLALAPPAEATKTEAPE